MSLNNRPIDKHILITSYSSFTDGQNKSHRSEKGSNSSTATMISTEAMRQIVEKLKGESIRKSIKKQLLLCMEKF